MMQQMNWNDKLNDLSSQKTHFSNLLQNRILFIHGLKVELKLLQTKGSMLSDIHSKASCSLCKLLNTSMDDTIYFNDRFSIVHNPFSPFSSHFYLVDRMHRISGKPDVVFQMLSAAREMDRYVILCDGIYFPDELKRHFYMHVVSQNSFPLEEEYDIESSKYLIAKSDKGEVFVSKNVIKNALVIVSDDYEWIADVYFDCEKLLGRSYSLSKFPYLNLISWYKNGKWVLVIFPRVVQKTTEYYEKGDGQYKIIPGALEMSGVFSVDFEKYFDNLNVEIISNIYTQISFGFNHLLEVITPLNVR
jgi:hypothetical protein